MMRMSLCVAVALACVPRVSGEDKKPENKLPDTVATALQKADELEVYSLSGKTADKDGWHGYETLGKTTIKGKPQKELAAAVKKGVAEGNKGARCFIPRHGIRVTHSGKTYDLVICFQCGWVYIYTAGSDKPHVLMMTDAPQKALNKILADAKVELAKPEK